MIFSYFDAKEYNNIRLTDIFKNYRTYFDKAIKNFNIKDYYITGAPRPEELSYMLYENVNLYWVLLLLNNVYDPYYDWIKEQDVCYKMAEQKYKYIGNHIVYHRDKEYNKYYNLVEYPKGSNLYYDKGDTKYKHLQYSGSLVPVDIYEDAVIENEKYRRIKIIDPEDIGNFISNFIRHMETA